MTTQAGLRGRWWIRWAAFAASAVIAAVVLLDVGLDPAKLYAWLRQPVPAPVRSSQNTPPPAPRVVLPEQKAIAPTLLAGNNSSLAKSQQHLILTGVVPGRNFKEGYAILGVTRENPQTYAAGALLANQARLTEIHPKYVVLERAGQSVRLYLEGSGPQLAGRAGQEGILSVGGEAPPTPTVVSSAEPVTDYFRPTPVYDGERLVGYQVYPGSKTGVFAAIGLQAGDVITAIGGVPLSDPGQATDLFHQLVNGTVLTAAVTRKGRSEQLTLNGAVILMEQERARQAAMTPATQMVGPGT
jgi:general secretion pathway protein C